MLLADIHANPVHPHACGENEGIAVMSIKIAGTPPRVWGKPRLMLLR